MYKALKNPVEDQGVPPDLFLDQQIAWVKFAPDEIFLPRPDDQGETDIYTLVRPILGPWINLQHRKAVMLEVQRVLAGFESSWDFEEGVDTTNASSMKNRKREETGAFQVSYDSLEFGSDLRHIAPAFVDKFIDAMKADHDLAFEYIARLLRHTIRHNGPVKRKEILPYLCGAAVLEYYTLLA